VSVFSPASGRRLAAALHERRAGRIAARGVREVTVVCPGFAVDCLETLEEIDMENREIFMRAGVPTVPVRPGTERSSEHARFLSELIARHCQGWTHVELGRRRLAPPAAAPPSKGEHDTSGDERARTFPRDQRRDADIRASVEFYEQLGFLPRATTTDTWPHPTAFSRTDGFSSACTSGALPHPP